MFRSTKLTSMLLLAATMVFAATIRADVKYPGVGRAATAAEIKAWDIDVRPDLTGLPPGSGSVAKGQEIWESKCASCHGTFGESNEVFSPLVGGTTAEDIKTGRVKALQEPVARSTLMKVSSISTLWDYINRAMPWNAPKSLSADEVYATLAYLLHLGDIIPADYVLSETNMRAVQERLPNRNGMIKHDRLWNISGKGDVQNSACMKDCVIDRGLASALPDSARGTHGNLAEQQRAVGSARFIDPASATKPSEIGPIANVAASTVAKSPNASMSDLARKTNCMACHHVDKKLVGPSFLEIAARYKSDNAAEARLVEKIRAGGSGVWGAVPMPPTALRTEDIRALTKWVLAGAPGK